MDFLSIQVDKVCLKQASANYLNDLRLEALLEKDFSKFPPKFAKELINEVGNVSGVFGWCYVCRETANYYCKE